MRLAKICPLDVSVLLDLVAIADALDASARERGAGAEERAALRDVRRKLKTSLTLARHALAGTSDARRAERLADEALRDLARVLDPAGTGEVVGLPAGVGRRMLGGRVA